MRGKYGFNWLQQSNSTRFFPLSFFKILLGRNTQKIKYIRSDGWTDSKKRGQINMLVRGNIWRGIHLCELNITSNVNTVVVPKCFIKYMCFNVLYFDGHAFFSLEIAKKCFLCFIF